MLRTENLSHRFSDGTLGIDDINLTIHAGELVLIAGPNGSGKSTLVRHFNGLLLPTEGRVLLDDMDVAGDSVRARQLVGMVFQDADSQIVGETVYDDVAFGPENLRLAHGEIVDRVNHALQMVDLSYLAEQRPHLLSGGEKRRLAIAGVLAMRPKMVIFDEPFASLDYEGVRQVLEQIVKLHEAGHTLVVITHDLEKIIAHATRLVVMSRGKVFRDGKPAQLMASLGQFGIREPCAHRFGRQVDSWLS